MYDGRMQNDTLPAEAIIEVDIDAAPESVWQALTTDDGLANWIGAGSSIGTSPGDELDVHDVVTGQRKRGYLDEVTPLKRLGYTWWPETAPEHSTRVAISLEPCETGTRVTVVESRPSAPVAARHARLQANCAARIGVDWTWRQAMLRVSLHHASAVFAACR